MANLSKKPALGKGLETILNPKGNSNQFESDGLKPQDTIGKVVHLSPFQIELNPNQPRKDFDENAIDELSNSIVKHGLIQPITVRKISKTKSYQLISGERRLKAAQKVKLKTIPAYVRLVEDDELLKLALIENIHRKDLNPIEIGISYQQLINELGLTHIQLSEIISKERSTITNYIRLLKLPAEIQIALREGFISYGHGRALVSVETTEKQIEFFDKITQKELSVRATEDLIKKQKSKNTSVTKKTENARVEELQKNLSKHLNNPVSLRINRKGDGYIKIAFKSENKLNAILKRIRGEK